MRGLKYFCLIALTGLGFSLFDFADAQTTSAQYPDYSQTSSQELQRLSRAGDVHAVFTLGYNYFFDSHGAPKENIANVEKLRTVTSALYK